VDSYTERVGASPGLTAQQKVNLLDQCSGRLRIIAPLYHETIVKASTSLASIWQIIRLHYGFQATGAHLFDLADFKIQSDERHEDLHQRLMAFFEDNLLLKDGLNHQGIPLEEDEEMSPSLINIVVLHWLQLVYPSLPRLVKQRYGTELRSRTLASIKPEISRALDSLQDEVHTSADAKAFRVATSSFQRQQTVSPPSNKTRPHNSPLSCPLCKQAGQPDRHFLSKCSFLPDQDRQYMAKVRKVVAILDDDDGEVITYLFTPRG